VSTTPASGSGQGLAERMGVRSGMLVMEVGFDDDVDTALREALQEQTGESLVDEESDEVVDVVLCWYREGDGDLVDILVDCVSPLADEGVIWLLTPKRGHGGSVDASDISEAASVAGLSETSIIMVSSEWSGVRLVGRKSGGKR
jgi:Protein of unknown function (DUF3052)